MPFNLLISRLGNWDRETCEGPIAPWRRSWGRSQVVEGEISADAGCFIGVRWTLCHDWVVVVVVVVVAVPG